MSAVLLRGLGALVVLIAAFAPLRGQHIYQLGNSASYAENAIARGSVVVLLGDRLGPDVLQQAGSFPLPTILARTSVRVTIGSTSADVPMVYASYYQTAVLLPSRFPAGRGSISVTFQGRASSAVPITVAESAFGIYSMTSNGQGEAVITTADYQPKTYQNAAKPGETLILWGTGLGAVDGDDAAGALPGHRFPNTQLEVGGQRATVTYAGRSGCCAGLDQIVFRVPAGVSGCFVPVVVRSGAMTSNFLSLPVSADGAACSDPVGLPPEILARVTGNQPVQVGTLASGPVPILEAFGFHFSDQLAGRLSAMLKTKVSKKDLKILMNPMRSSRERRAVLEKYRALLQAGKLKSAELQKLMKDFTRQGAAAAFQKVEGIRQIVGQFAAVLPPAGTCTLASNWQLNPENWGASNAASDAGTELLFNGPVGLHTLARRSKGTYTTTLGSIASTKLPTGDYTMTGTGGADVGSFRATMSNREDLIWIDKSLVVVLDRTQPMTVRWSGGGGSQYVLFGGATYADHEGSTAFACVERATRHELTVPLHVLQGMMAPRGEPGYLFLIAHPLNTRFEAPSLDLGYFIDFGTEYREVGVR